MYDNLHNQNLYTKSLEDFQSQFFTPSQPKPDPAKDDFMTEAVKNMTKQQADQAWEVTQPKKKEKQFIQ